MPIENERKYVLRDPQKVLEIYPHWLTLRQGYLRGDARVRHVIHPRHPSQTIFTYKIMVGDDLVEIECSISQEDFDRLWSIADRRVSKKRWSYQAGADHWDIDVFLDQNGDPYLAMAECEMEAGKDAPDEIPMFIRDHIVYEVPRSRTLDFTNTRLGDPKYGGAIYMLIDTPWLKH